ncbi:zinc-RING finger [Pyrrhoderma noxium]|uniref:Zinc-RING finger n=1 Tax=Pyrrhoderma noxium TaxID=2282107 RepID=A0A286UX28_9AGAM|nr:zinc-RING finger [Pyrrhoderma noxium]
MEQENPQDFNIWEFVTCAICQTTFLPNGASVPTIPFWITECGHVLCNSHLNADKSCTYCNAQRIELMPLQKEMPPPFSDWFCSLPFKLDALAQAAKFQHERLTNAARYYKSRYLQYRAMSIQKHNEIKALKKEIEMLKAENAQTLQRGQDPSSYINGNGKRPMTDNRLSASSPRSIHTPLGPPRITLPPDADPPPSLSRLSGSDENRSPYLQRQTNYANEPPGSSHFNQKYAYKNSQVNQIQGSSQAVSGQPQERTFDSRQMPPPPTPTHFQRFSEEYHNHEHQRLSTSRAEIPSQVRVGQNLPIGHNTSTQSLQKVQQNQSQAPRRFIPLWHLDRRLRTR